MNPFEGIRSVLGFLDIIVVAWGLNKVRNGMYAFDYAIRKNMVFRRQVQMWTYFSWSISLCIQALLALRIPDQRPMTTDMIAINILYIYNMITLMALATFQCLGWVKFQEILGNKPLVPDTAEEAVQIGRNMGHTISGNLTEMVLFMELLSVRKDLPDDLKEEITSVMERLVVAGDEVNGLHKKLKELLPNV